MSPRTSAPSSLAASAACLGLAAWTAATAAPSPDLPSSPPAATDGHAVIRAPAGPSEIVVTTTSRLAGAIHSLTWNGREFVDSHDHGRQLQSAASFDGARSAPFWAECYNPTEAGSRADGTGATSSSRLLELTTTGGTELRTRTRLAFWLAPGETSYGRPALNRTVLSDHLLAKRVRLGHEGLPHVLDYEVTFTVPEGEHHTLAQFEALTCYMPADFSKFWTFHADSGRLEPLDDGPGEQVHPVVFSTGDAGHAMGIMAARGTHSGAEGPRYGRFRFPNDGVVKWNCVFRVRADPIAAGDYQFPLRVAVGTLENVRQSLATLAKEAPSS